MKYLRLLLIVGATLLSSIVWAESGGDCGFHGHPATYSINIRPLIPR
ncbi:co-regulatory protein PtrA N-terminal domain-containing protein [Pseudomonas veronii]